jgi:hypothetical protein
MPVMPVQNLSGVVAAHAEHRRLAVEMEHRPASTFGRLEYLQIKGQSNFAVGRFVQDRRVRELRRKEDAVRPRIERCFQHPPGDVRNHRQCRLHRVPMCPQMIKDLTIGELHRNRQRAKNRLEDRHLGLDPLPRPVQRVQDHFVETGARIDRLQARPILRPLYRNVGRRPRPFRRSLEHGLAAPINNRVIAWRHELNEIETVASLPGDGAGRETLGGLIPLREVAPKADRRMIDRLTPDRGFNPFARSHRRFVRHRE